MLLQLTGRLEPGETHATIDVDVASIFSGKKAIVLTLLNISFCSQVDHNHFPPDVTALYPVDPDGYKETITVVQRLKRSAEEEPKVDREKRRTTASVLPMEIRYYAGFRKIIFDFVIADFKNQSPKTLVEQTLNVDHSRATANHFQQLLTHPLRYELTEANERSQKKVQISLPPLTRLLCNLTSFFGLLGFEPPQLQKIVDHDVWYLENTSQTQSQVFLATKSVNTNLKFSYHLGRYQPQDAYTINVQRLEPNFSSVLALDSFCERNPSASHKLFQLLLEGTVQILGLPTDSLQAKLVTADVVSLEKADGLKNEADAEDNFGLNIELGTQMHEMVGTISDRISWSLKNLEVKILPPSSQPTAEQITRCGHVIDSLHISFLNQRGEHPIVKGWQTRYQQYLTDMANSTAQQGGGGGGGNDNNDAGGAAAGAAAADVTQQHHQEEEIVPPAVDPPVIVQPQPEVVEQQPEVVEQQQEVVEQQPEIVEEQQQPPPPEEENLGGGGGGGEEEAPAEQEPAGKEPPPPPKPPTPPPEPPVKKIVINNPARRPPSRYVVANSLKSHICTDPLSFPENCTLVVREGEPYDFVASRGPCSVLGLLRKSVQPNVLSNDCVIKSRPNLDFLSLEIIDNALNTFRNTGNKSMWIKLDLQYAYLN